MGFDSYHPGLNVLFFAIAASCALMWNQPIFVAISFATSFIYSVWLGRKSALKLNIVLVVLGVLYMLWYVMTNHFGTTILTQNFIGNCITLESLAYALTLSARIVSFIMWLSCLVRLFTADKVVYLIGRISPKTSLFVSIILRALPRLSAQTSRVSLAQFGIGRGMGQGNVFRRLRNIISILSSLISWALEALVQASDSMRSRGSNLKGRTAYSLYRFDYRDRTFVIWMALLVAIMSCGVVLDQTNILYSPYLAMNRVTPLSCVFYISYAVFCLMPMGLHIVSLWRFAASRRAVADSIN